MRPLTDSLGLPLLAAKLTFREPDRVKYPCINLAYAAGRQAGSMTAAMNAANERANEMFRGGEIQVMQTHLRNLCFPYSLLA